jgi:pyrimidine operon attenuation protein/uracil phosphoribosyltransferase
MSSLADLGSKHYIGKNLPTRRRESVAVMLREHDGIDRVVIQEL